MEYLEQLLQEANDKLFCTADYQVNESIIKVITEIEKQINRLKNENI